MNSKLTSRKFWICVAAFLASIATSIAGLASSNTTVAAIGTICGILSAAIYAFCEAWVDGKAVEGNVIPFDASAKDVTVNVVMG